MHSPRLPAFPWMPASVRRVATLACLAFLPAAIPAENLRPRVARVDLFDVEGTGKVNQRHFQHWSKRTVACCLDLAWMPWNPGGGGFQAGGGVDLGGWVQDMETGPHVRVADILLEGSARLSSPAAPLSLWARLDLGPALLVVERRRVGVDLGVGGAFQMGLAFAARSSDLLVGAGVDFRRYANLPVAEIPALTLSVGAGL